MTATTRESAEPRFWRDDAVAFIEARSIEDARDVHYAKHAHEAFSIGAISAGSCVYLNGRTRQRIGVGSVVVMNPGDVHACSSVGHQRCSYRMLYVDVSWLAGIQHDLGVSRHPHFRPVATLATTHGLLSSGLNRLYDVLTDPQREPLQKHEAALTFKTNVQLTLNPAQHIEHRRPRNIERAAEFIRDHYKRSLGLQDICCAAGVSAPYLIRAFKHEYGLTPHAYLVNCRIEFARSQLRKGRPIAAVAFEAGFADQAHLQRAFKRIVAATPGQYRAGRVCDTEGHFVQYRSAPAE